MRRSLACRSGKVLDNIAKTHARRAALATPPTHEHVQFRDETGQSAVLPRLTSHNPRETAQKSLERLLEIDGAFYQDVWQAYTTLKGVMERERGSPIPSHILQGVLRKCTPSWGALRTNATQPPTEYGTWVRLKDPFPLETRLRSILSYMRKSMQPPTEDDYSFICKQMMAVGYYAGILDMLKEMKIDGVPPSSAIFVHGLRACVFLLETPSSGDQRAFVLKCRAVITASKLVKRMQGARVEVDSTVVELVLRIFKAQPGPDACEQILRFACAFDIRHPDRMPEEFEKRLKEADERNEPLPVPVPMTASMLTTMVNLYGTKGLISKMISTFEVLTNPYPLPSNLPSPQSDWWDTEDEYDVANPVIQTPLKHRPEYVWEPPRASPNSATFAAMIKHLAWARQRVLCEHYMLLAEDYDKTESTRIRQDLNEELERMESLESRANSDRIAEEVTDERGPKFIQAPRFLITAQMFQPVFVYANQARLTELTRWIRAHLRGIIWRREEELDFFRKSYEALPRPTIPAGAEIRMNAAHRPWIDYSGIVPGTERPRPLDLPLHIKLVEETLDNLGQMLERADEVVARLSQRTVERMTRRVWNDQDVFLSDVGKRTRVGRAEWAERLKWTEWNGKVTDTRANKVRSSGYSLEKSAPARWAVQQSSSEQPAKDLKDVD